MQNRKVLIVEDEMLISLRIKAELESLGFTVTDRLTRAEEVLGSVARESPDLILMDVKLAGTMDGIEAANRLRVHHRIPVIFLTAHAEPEIIERAKETQPYGYLLKPFSSDELRATVEMSLYNAQVDNEKYELMNQLQEALEKVKQLSGLLPICSWCKKIRNDQGYWEQLESYITQHSSVEFTHGVCGECKSKVMARRDQDDT